MFLFTSRKFLMLGILAMLMAGSAIAAEQPAEMPIIPAANPIPNSSPFIKPAPGLRIVKGKTEVVSVRMLSTRPSGVGGVQPFKVRDVRNVIDPERRIMLASSGANCPNGTASTTTNLIVFILPSNGTACNFLPAIGIGSNPDVIFTIGGFTPSNATLTPNNGWSVSPTLVNSSDVTSVPNSVTISKNGITYNMTLTVASDQLSPGDGYVSVSNFMKF